VLALAAIGALALAGAIVAGATWRRGADERQSVKAYHTTLETLRHVSDRVDTSRPRPAARNGRVPAPKAAGPARGRNEEPAPSVRVPSRSTAAAAAGATSAPAEAGRTRQRARRAVDDVDDVDEAHRVRTPAAVAVNGSAKAPEEGDRPSLVFDDGAPPPSVDDPDGRRAIARMGARRAKGTEHAGRVLAVAVVVVLVAAVVGAVVAFLPSSGKGTTTPPAHVGGTSPGATVPAPVPSTVNASVSTTSTATYNAPAGPYTVVLAATGDCWVMAADAATGRILFTGTMGAGQTQTLTETAGSLKVTLGAASDMTMTLDGKAVTLPTPFQSPFVATFAPSA